MKVISVDSHFTYILICIYGAQLIIIVRVIDGRSVLLKASRKNQKERRFVNAMIIDNYMIKVKVTKAKFQSLPPLDNLIQFDLTV